MINKETRSLAEIFAEDYTEEQRQQILDSMSEEERMALNFDADFWLRPSQKIPDGDWFITALVAGRGFGKTLAMSQWVRRMAMENPGCRIAIGGRTSGDVRRIMIEGESGILAISPEDERPEYKQQKAALYWPNGSMAELHSSEAPDAARGVQYHFTVGDEFAAWKSNTDASGATLYSNLIAATRLGMNPKILLATTPKRTASMKNLMERSRDPEERVVIIRGSTFENTTLSKNYVNNLVRQYGNSDLAKQELDGQMLEDSEGIVFTSAMLEDAKKHSGIPYLPIRLIAVDPSVSGDPRASDECGIMAIGATDNYDVTRRVAYVLKDYSLRASPDIWAERVVQAAAEQKTKNIVVEKNQGGDLLRMVIKAKDPTLKVYLVTATKGKLIRAEPIVVAMQQGRVKFAESFEDLEDQLLFYDPDNSNYSPDRMDAFVWGITSVLVDPPKGLKGGKTVARSASHRKLPTGLGQGRSRAHTSLRRR